MATTGRIGAVFDAGTTPGLGPAELLGRFGATRDEAAFAALVEHHGPMVLATCRRILPDHADADDAFQATFLVLARRAGAIGDPDRLAPWLHGVARRVSVKARARAARRRQVEGTRPGDVAAPDPVDDARELRSVLDEELAHLPAKYRVPLVLCYLEGLTHDQAAGQLKWPVGTVRSRLAGGRDRLRSRLARRGFAPTVLATLSPATLPSAAVSHLLRAATVRLVVAPTAVAVATPAALLAQGVLTSMFVTKLQALGLAAATTLALGTVGLVAASPQFGGAGPGSPAQVPPPADTKPAEPPQAAPDQLKSVATPGDLARALDAARARIKDLEAELAALKAKATPGPGMAPAKKGTNLRGADRAAGPSGMMGGGMGMGPPAAGRMMGGGMGSPGGMPGGAAGSANVPMLLSNGRVLFTPTERNRIMAVDTNTGLKDVFRPMGEINQIVPYWSSGVVGLGVQGPRVEQLAAYSLQGSRWYPVTSASRSSVARRSRPSPRNTSSIAWDASSICLAPRPNAGASWSCNDPRLPTKPRSTV